MDRTSPTTTPAPVRRRRRISDEETERRMLTTAVEAVSRTGLTVSLEHLSFEDIIRQADVSRSSAYRRWPYRDLFFADLLLTLADSTDLAGEAGSLVASALEVVRLRAHELLDPVGRRDLVVDVLRQIFDADFRVVYSSPRWRTYIALNSTFLGLPDGDLRKRVGDALATTERRFATRRAQLLAAVVPLMGYRLVEPLTGEDGFELMAFAVASTYTGLVVRALSDPSLLIESRPMRAFGSTSSTPWSVPDYVGVATFLSYIEPDPDVIWDSERVAAVTAGLERWHGGAPGETE